MERLCTFKPQLYSKTVNRTFEAFLESQEAHHSKVAHIVAEERGAKESKEISSMQDKPFISKKSKELIEGKLRGDLVERLYERRTTSPLKNGYKERAQTVALV